VGRLLAASALAGVCLLLAAPAGSAVTGPRVFADPVGDAGTASDIEEVWISNNLDGDYLIDTSFATPIVPVSNYVVYLDLDRNPETGSPGGAEFSIGHCRGELIVNTWNGRRWVASGGSAGEAVSPDATYISFTFRKSDIGGDEDFDVYAISRRMDGSDDEDDAPAGTRNIHYEYANRVTIVGAGTAQMPAQAGGTWTLGVLARRSDTGESLQAGGRIRCSATAGGAKLPVRAKGFSPVIHNGRRLTFSACEFAIAKGLRNRTLRATVTVRYRGSSVTRTFTAKATFVTA
jgi:hypothetical protein